jgi:hypothetical protein
LLDEIDEAAATRLAWGTRWAAPLVSVAVAVVWFLLATAHPTTTFHFVPLLVAAAWSVIRRCAGVPAPLRPPRQAVRSSRWRPPRCWPPGTRWPDRQWSGREVRWPKR